MEQIFGANGYENQEKTDGCDCPCRGPFESRYIRRRRLFGHFLSEKAKEGGGGGGEKEEEGSGFLMQRKKREASYYGAMNRFKIIKN